jgi:signal transduction histidine kinase
VAGVAHEVYNPLNAIAGSISSLERVRAELTEMLTAYREAEAGLGEPARRALEDKRRHLDIAGALDDLAGVAKVVQSATRRSVEIVASLKSFSRAPAEPIPSDLHAGLGETLALLRYRIDKQGIEVVDRRGDLPQVVCRTGEINQVFMNLLSNAIQAVTERHPDGGGRIEVHSRSDGDSVVIGVGDNGPGVPDDLRQRVFDPFFTTKPFGEGTGLGLSISAEIIRRHGGSLAVERADELEGGARFIVRLPLVPRPARSLLSPPAGAGIAAPASAAKKSRAGRGGRRPQTT